MGLPKIALFTSTGMDCSGAVAVEPLDFPPDLLDGPALWRNLLTLEQMAGALQSRPRRGHKGTFGAAAICGGSEGMSGALMLAGESALRSGCGLVYLAPPAGLLPIVEARLLEPVKWKLAGARDYLNMRGAESFAGQCQDVQAAALGPGLGRCQETVEAVQYLCERLEKPLVLDADGLNALQQDAGRLLRRKAPTVLTPHPRELSRIWGKSVEEIQKSRFACAREFARTFQCHLVLKGAGTVVAAPDGRVFLNPTGNTGLAKGGSGDILTGLIAGLLAQGYDALEASCLGVFLHGLAADLAVKDSSPRALTPSGVIASLGAAWRKLESVQRDFVSGVRV